MLTHVVLEWARGLGGDIWMNIDISLAPCGVSAGVTRACKTLTKKQSLPVTEVFLFLSPSAVQFCLLRETIKVNHYCIWHSEMLSEVDQVARLWKLRIQTNWDRDVCWTNSFLWHPHLCKSVGCQKKQPAPIWTSPFLQHRLTVYIILCEECLSAWGTRGGKVLSFRVLEIAVSAREALWQSHFKGQGSNYPIPCCCRLFPL